MKKEGGEMVVVSTFFEGHATKKIIPKLLTDRLVLLIDEPNDQNKKEKINQAVMSIKDFFKEALPVETLKISAYDIPKIIGIVLKKIDSESEQGNKITVHITEGRKTISLALLYAAYMRKDKIESIYYITEEDQTLISLPILSFELSETKKKMLKLIDKGVKDVDKMMSELDIKQSAIYQNINDLKKEGYIDKGYGLQVTDLGKIMVA